MAQTDGSSVSKVFSFFKNGLGIAFGKVAEKEGVADFDWTIHANKGLLVNGTDINVMIQKLYPIGHIIMSANSANPSTYLGFGTWVEWGSGRVPVGVNASDTDFNTVEKAGGSKTINLEHQHTETVGADDNRMFLSASANGGLWGSNVIGSANAMSWTGTPSSRRIRVNYTQKSLSGGKTIVQPYITCYMWKRTE